MTVGTPARLRVFVSSVQKELEDERLVVQNLINTDAFLGAHCFPVLYELEPASPDQALTGCLASLDGCHVYVLIIGIEYGASVGEVSITHAEYRRAKQRKLPVLAFIKGDRHIKRETGTAALLAELDADGPKYKRFGNVIELQKEVRAALLKLLLDRFGIAPTSDENTIAEQSIEATSPFESQPMMRVRWGELDHEVLQRLLAAAEQRPARNFSSEELLAGASLRGLFPQCRILADAYRGAEPDGDPHDHEDLRAPMPLAIERAAAFIDRNTRHPMRVVGLNRVRIDEYPMAGVREALVNAVTHRQYDDGGRKIMLEVFSDRIVVSSPGLPPEPITLASLRKGKYRPCSRNPVLAQSLSYFHHIEERGSGFRRMREEMLDHGLDAPLLSTETGYFQVTFPGPGDDLERLRIPTERLLVTPAIEEKLNVRQRRVLEQVAETGSVTTGWCMEVLSVARDTAHRDLVGLVELGLLARRGSGRAATYVSRDRAPSP